MGKELTLFAKNIRLLRKRRRLTLSEMQDSSGFKVSTWSNYENGNTEPDFNALIQISTYFGISIDDLLLVDMENVQLMDNKRSTNFQGKSTANGTANSTAKPAKYGDYNLPESVLNEPENSREWLIAKMLKENSEKLDQLLLLAKKKDDK